MKFGVCVVLLVVGVSGLWMLLKPTVRSADEARGADCGSVKTSLSELLPATTTTTRAPGTGIGPWTINPASTPEYRQKWLSAMHLILNSQQCFTVTEVSQVQAALVVAEGH